MLTNRPTTNNDINFRHIFEHLNEILLFLAEENGFSNVHELTRDLHVWPDFHGNRSPIADSSIKGMICGLTMTPTEDNLAITYLAVLQAIAVSLLIFRSFKNVFNFNLPK